MGNATKTISKEGRRGSGAAVESPHLFLVLNCDRPSAPAVRCSLQRFDEVMLGRADRRGVSQHDASGVPRLTLGIDDPWMSGSHALLRRVLGSWTIEDLGSKNGTLVGGRKCERAQELRDGDLIELGHTFFLFRARMRESGGTVDSSSLSPAAAGFATLLPSLADSFSKVQAVARSAVPVVVRGESGTGKEVVASAIHALSGRTGPFQAVNCGALPAALVESELLGFRKGAFTGADDDRAGLVRTAHGGTLFLDEIGDLPLAAQAALLRVLQEGEVHPLGATRALKVDVRLVSATHRDLEALAAEEKFRSDLLARLGGLTIHLPPLRERREDLGLIMAALLRRHFPEREIELAANAARALLVYQWPLNVRELERCLQAAVVQAGDRPVELQHLPPAVAASLSERAPSPGPALPLDLPEPDRRRREQIVDALRAEGGNVTAAARRMDKARVQLQRWIKRYRIDRSEFQR
jgi:sigma-54 dependent transcriptional regulator, acetoin dehydrogenase operon transcriptional activator AcoR